MKKNISLKKSLFAVWLIVIASAVYYLLTKGVSVDSMQDYFKNLGAWAILLYVVAYIIRPIIFFPTSVMTPLSALLFGPYFGWIYAYVGETLSASVAFFLARYFGRDFVKKKENAFIKKYDDKLICCGFETILFLRLVPLFPFDFVNYTSGLSSVKYRDYLLATLVGVIPGLTAYIFLGGSLMNPALIIPTILFFIILTYVSRKLHGHYDKKHFAKIEETKD